MPGIITILSNSRDCTLYIFTSFTQEPDNWRSGLWLIHSFPWVYLSRALFSTTLSFTCSSFRETELQQALGLIHSHLQARRTRLDMSLKQYFIIQKVAVRKILVRSSSAPALHFVSFSRWHPEHSARPPLMSGGGAGAYKHPRPKSDPRSPQSDLEHFVPTTQWPCLCFAPSQLSFISTLTQTWRGEPRAPQRNQTF